jgi:membrane protease YdiL (CAAX protease family)
MAPAARSTDLLAAGVLLGYHAAVHERWSPGARLAANLAAAASAVGVAAAAGLTLDEMGLSIEQAGRGLVYGTLVSLPIAAAIASVARAPRAGAFFADQRAANLSRRGAAYEMFVRIPFETGLSEEVLFRGVHLGMTRRLHPPPWAVARTSAAFGLWHVLPAIASLRRTDLGAAYAGSSSRRAGAIAATVIATALAGAVFALLRLRSGSVLAPAVVHSTLNATALACAIAYWRRNDATRPATALEPSTEGVS